MNSIGQYAQPEKCINGSSTNVQGEMIDEPRGFASLPNEFHSHDRSPWPVDSLCCATNERISIELILADTLKADAMHILLYIPNLIGYFRLGLLVFAWYFFDQPVIFLPLYAVQAVLDGVDGWAARRFDQESKFGAWLDVVVDNIGRGLLWTRVSSIGIFICSIEWITFVALNSHGSQWKSKLATSNDLIVRNIMKNGFRTVFGFVCVVLGIHCLPVVVYVMKHAVVLDWCARLLYHLRIICIIGRLFSLYSEVYVIRLFIAEDLLK